MDIIRGIEWPTTGLVTIVPVTGPINCHDHTYGHKVAELTKDGWRVLGMFEGRGVTGYVKSKDESRPSYDCHDPVHGTMVSAVMHRSEESVLAECAAKTATAMVDAARLNREAVALTKERDEANASLDGYRDLAAGRLTEIDTLRKVSQKLERHLGAVREAVGSERFKAITDANDNNDDNIPF